MVYYRFPFTVAAAALLLLLLLGTNVDAENTRQHRQNRNDVLQHLARRLRQVMTTRSLVTNRYYEEGGDESPTTSLTSTSNINTHKSAYNYNSGYSLGSSSSTTTSKTATSTTEDEASSSSEEEEDADMEFQEGDELDEESASSSSEEDDAEIEGSEEDEESPSSLSDEEDDADMEGSEENDEGEEAYPLTTEDAPSSEEDEEVPGEIEMQDADDVPDEETDDTDIDGTDNNMLGSLVMGEENEMLMGLDMVDLFGIDPTCFTQASKNDCVGADPVNHEGCSWCRLTVTPPDHYEDGACFPNSILQDAEAGGGIPHVVCGDDVERVITPEEQETEDAFWNTLEGCVENGLGVDSCLDESSDCLWCQTYSDVGMTGGYGLCLSQASMIYADLLPEQWRNSLFSNYIGCTTEREQFEQEGEPAVSSILDMSCMGYDEGNIEDLPQVATDLNAKDVMDMADAMAFGTFDPDLCTRRVDAVGNPCAPTSIMGMIDICLTQGQSNVVTSILESLQSGEMSGMIKNQQAELEEGDGGIFGTLLSTLGTSLDGLEEFMEATIEEEEGEGEMGFGESGSESSSSMMLGGDSDTWSPYDENGNYVGHVGDHDTSESPITKELEGEEEEEEEEEEGVDYIGHVGEGSTLYNGTIPTKKEPFTFPDGDEEEENEEAPVDDGEEEEYEEEYGTSSGAIPDGMLPPGVVAEEPEELPVIDVSDIMPNNFKDGEKHSVQWDPEKEAFIWDDGMVVLPPEEEEDVPTKEIEDGSSTGEEEYGEEDVPTEDFGADEEEVPTEEEYGEEEDLPTEDIGVDEEEEMLSEEGEEEENDVSIEESEEEGESLEDGNEEEEYPTETESEEEEVPTESSSSSYSSSSNIKKYDNSISSFQSQYPSSSSTTKEIDNEDDQPEEGILDEPSEEEEGEEPIDETYGETSSETSEEEESNYSTSEEAEYPLSEEEELGESDQEEESEEEYDDYGDTEEEGSEYGDRENDEEYDEPVMTPLTEEDLSATEMLKSEESEAIAEYVEGEEEYEEEEDESGYRSLRGVVRRV